MKNRNFVLGCVVLMASCKTRGSTVSISQFSSNSDFYKLTSNDEVTCIMGAIVDKKLPHPKMFEYGDLLLNQANKQATLVLTSEEAQTCKFKDKYFIPKSSQNSVILVFKLNGFSVDCGTIFLKGTTEDKKNSIVIEDRRSAGCDMEPGPSTVITLEGVFEGNSNQQIKYKNTYHLEPLYNYIP